jgi:hypothetical protein
LASAATVIARGVTVPDDLALPVHVVAIHGNHLGGQGDVAIRQSNAIERKLEITFTHEVAGIFAGLKVPYKVGAAGKDDLAELLHGLRVAKKRIAYTDGG